jgi:hypothetical protein
MYISDDNLGHEVRHYRALKQILRLLKSHVEFLIIMFSSAVFYLTRNRWTSVPAKERIEEKGVRESDSKSIVTYTCSSSGEISWRQTVGRCACVCVSTETPVGARYEKFSVCYLHSELLGIKDFVNETIVNAFLRTEVPHSTRVLLYHSKVLAASLWDK